MTAPSVSDFLHAVRHEPGFWLRVGSVAVFTAALVRDRGLLFLIVLTTGTLVVGLPIGYFFYRRRGHLPGGQKPDTDRRP